VESQGTKHRFDLVHDPTRGLLDRLRKRIVKSGRFVKLEIGLDWRLLWRR
jgi:hypothetical protein